MLGYAAVACTVPNLLVEIGTAIDAAAVLGIMQPTKTNRRCASALTPGRYRRRAPVRLTISHPRLSVPIRVTDNDVDLVSGGDTYLACPFFLELPSDEEDRPPRARLRIDNVDRNQVRAVRLADSAPTVVRPRRHCVATPPPTGL